jgi:molybdopterin synthase catalytic subunit/molybdopterin converting factor small subunit
MLKDITGSSGEVLELAAGSTLGCIFGHYASKFPDLERLRSSIMLARNHDFGPPETSLADGDEVAFLPPVSGGSGPYIHEIAEDAGHFYALTRELIDTRALVARLQRGEDGAVVAFEGVVRNNTLGRATLYLEYECYEPMAVRMMAAIGHSIASGLEIGRIGMIHRLGRLNIGEASVVIVVTAPHRKPAFEAALDGINRLKKLVPIWKKEHFADGEVWVEGEWDESLKNR